ncbi:hypothetical protein P3T36_007310 [Kitasatospora sp. MAP12-15]|uniref:hypothetical protein n=1 Tax=unclassified Kitasatospora TaxID=2633591 RepID=UPI0024748C93|nr:hypothetical protein [Kitasatospora sp. MAP12-44]MDH6115021.1 hypothetical protein [Kitasatospora sp. MAP12-44]
MHRIHEHLSIDALLDGAEVLGDEYEGYDSEAARRRIAHTVHARRRAAAHIGAQTPPRADAPPHAETPPRAFPAASDQAAHDLDLAVALIVDAPEAAGSLGRLVNDQCIEPSGALVFAALLHLAGYREAAGFWWRFAAGGGNRTAAFCLFLAHQQRAEYRDAAYWRAQSRRPPASAPGPAVRAARPLLPEQVRNDLLAQCHRGRHPALPARLEAVINGLPIDCADSDFGEIPQPSPTLLADLGASRSPGPPAGPC